MSRKNCDLVGLWDIPIKDNVGQGSLGPFIPHAYYFALGWHGLFKSGWEYNSLQYILKHCPVFKKVPSCFMGNLMLLLAQKFAFTVSDVSIAHDGDGYH